MRDSHELFDYESNNLKRKQFDFNQSGTHPCYTHSAIVGILRKDDELSTINEKDLFAKNSRALFKKM